ncbi:hypothetical protein RSOLAG1IB_09803 [Rhizoctonia solani AG-1 IB]|uniref:Uncharacterized protein n=1 Tax=Thanatephorus cucumeris (strain AG1-IB / isolate 7/3/14) TaxID=1108050 RepID=A0A0B7FT88_THACB|nr:hypothetical protein RSOLAG1IB_09803 [Rhizoctonia solani AG-1 IB]
MRYLTEGGGSRSRESVFLNTYLTSYMRTRQTAHHVSQLDAIPLYDFGMTYYARGSYLSSRFSAPAHHP